MPQWKYGAKHADNKAAINSVHMRKNNILQLPNNSFPSHDKRRFYQHTTFYKTPDTGKLAILGLGYDFENDLGLLYLFGHPHLNTR
jgi:hypothetical protein